MSLKVSVSKLEVYEYNYIKNDLKRHRKAKRGVKIGLKEFLKDYLKCHESFEIPSRLLEALLIDEERNKLLGELDMLYTDKSVDGIPNLLVGRSSKGQINPYNYYEVIEFANSQDIKFGSIGFFHKIETLEGYMVFKDFDYLIKNSTGECYVCARDFFEKTYKEVEE